MRCRQLMRWLGTGERSMFDQMDVHTKAVKYLRDAQVEATTSLYTVAAMIMLVVIFLTYSCGLALSRLIYVVRHRRSAGRANGPSSGPHGLGTARPMS
jgi:hypothetical protein